MGHVILDSGTLFREEGKIIKIWMGVNARSGSGILKNSNGTDPTFLGHISYLIANLVSKLADPSLKFFFPRETSLKF